MADGRPCTGGTYSVFERRGRCSAQRLCTSWVVSALFRRSPVRDCSCQAVVPDTTSVLTARAVRHCLVLGQQYESRCAPVAELHAQYLSQRQVTAHCDRARTGSGFGKHRFGVNWLIFGAEFQLQPTPVLEGFLVVGDGISRHRIRKNPLSRSTARKLQLHVKVKSKSVFSVISFALESRRHKPFDRAAAIACISSETLVARSLGQWHPLPHAP